MLRTIVIAGGLLTGSFFAGALNARRHVAPVTASLPAPRPPSMMPALPTPAPGKHTPRFTPPPLPTEDPGVAALVNAPREPSAAAVREAYEREDRRLEELFGAQFPVAKRDAVRAAQVTWMREHQHAVQDYYTGEINQAELELKVHQNMLLWSSQMQAALSSDEFRRFTDLEPGADPYVQLVPPGVHVGDSGERERAHP
jgi:hypothetical protein